ncbi:unnamed protein product [Colias eurytheme]|nr:unnamed protein product [Colias eurytheme]
MARNLTLTFFFLIRLALARAGNEVQGGFILPNNIENRVGDLVVYVTKYLEGFNDERFGKSDFGKYINYEKIKPKLDIAELEESRGMKKMAMGLMPLVFHVGATSTWMALTTILAAKAVFIGIILLVFKIAVSSAKVASFFTALKGQSKHHHDWSWSPHAEHHGYRRSLSNKGPGPSYELSYSWSPESSYKTLEYNIEHEHSEANIEKSLKTR